LGPIRASPLCSAPPIAAFLSSFLIGVSNASSNPNLCLCHHHRTARQQVVFHNGVSNIACDTTTNKVVDVAPFAATANAGLPCRDLGPSTCEAPAPAPATTVKTFSMPTITFSHPFLGKMGRRLQGQSSEKFFFPMAKANNYAKCKWVICKSGSGAPSAPAATAPATTVQVTVAAGAPSAAAMPAAMPASMPAAMPAAAAKTSLPIVPAAAAAAPVAAAKPAAAGAAVAPATAAAATAPAAAAGAPAAAPKAPAAEPAAAPADEAADEADAEEADVPAEEEAAEEAPVEEAAAP